MFRLGIVAHLMAILFASHVLMAPANAAVVTYDIGTIIFGGGPPPFGPVGSGQLTGTFDFDESSQTITAASFTASGTTTSAPSGTPDGVYESIQSFFLGTLTMWRSSDGSMPAFAATLNLGSLLRPTLSDRLVIGTVSVGSCMAQFSFPCALMRSENTSSAGVAMQTTGITPVPLPAALPLLAGGLGLLGLLGWRAKRKAAGT